MFDNLLPILNINCVEEVYKDDDGYHVITTSGRDFIVDEDVAELYATKLRIMNKSI